MTKAKTIRAALVAGALATGGAVAGIAGAAAAPGGSPPRARPRPPRRPIHDPDDPGSTVPTPRAAVERARSPNPSATRVPTWARALDRARDRARLRRPRGELPRPAPARPISSFLQRQAPLSWDGWPAVAQLARYPRVDLVTVVINSAPCPITPISR
jgi:hypothetical protein